MTDPDIRDVAAITVVKRCLDPESLEPVPIQLTRPKRVLAAEMGTVSETLSRKRATFRKQNLIEVKGATIIVRHPVHPMELLRRH